MSVPLATWPHLTALEAGKCDPSVSVCAQEGEELSLNSQPVSTTSLW